jgi:IS30 family transposase
VGSGPSLPLSSVSGADSRQIAATGSRAAESPRELRDHLRRYLCPPKGELRKALTEALRQEKPTRGQRRRTAAKGGSIAPEELSIAYPPEDSDSRLLPGHWERDLIKGAGNRSAVGTIVERKTRYVVLSRMRDSSPEAAPEGFTRQMKHAPAQMRQSLTYDRGNEMAWHAELARRLKLDIWFADPYAP